MRSHPSSTRWRHAPRFDILEDRRLLNAQALLELSQVQNSSRLAELRRLEEISETSVVSEDMAAPDTEMLPPADLTRNSTLNNRLMEELRVHNPIDKPVGISNLLPKLNFIPDDPVTSDPVAEETVDPPVSIDIPSVNPIPVDPPLGDPPARVGAPRDLIPIGTGATFHLGARSLLLHDSHESAATPANVVNGDSGANPTTESVQLAEAGSPGSMVSSEVRLAELTNAAGLVETGLVAVLLGIHDGGMHTAEVGAVDALGTLVQSGGLLAVASTGFEPALQGAGLAEYIPALETAALNFALSQSLSQFDLHEEFFSLLGSLSWKHVAAAGIVLTASCLAVQQLRPRRRGLWASRDLLHALAWTPQLAGARVE